jgi:Hint domain
LVFRGWTGSIVKWVSSDYILIRGRGLALTTEVPELRIEDSRVSNDIPQPARFSRRHLLKTVAIVTGALGASLSKSASAQANWEETANGSQAFTSQTTGNSQMSPPRHCFLRGTLIRSADGYRPIESLAVGDLVPTQFSGMAAIRKIVSVTVHRDEAGRWPDDCRPVRISAGALGDGVPTRDLFVTHTHAVFLGQVLVPIMSLVNGRTISFCDEIDRGSFEHFHIKLDDHDVIDAEGAFCESYRDETMEFCAPLALNGGRSRLWSHLRSAMAPVMDRRLPFDRIRDGLDIRAGL